MNARVSGAVDLAKRMLVDSIYASVCVEGLNITLPATERILNNLKDEVLPSDVVFVLNMRNAWRFIFDNLDYPVNLNFIRELNRICGVSLINGAGTLRTFAVTISGTKFVPELPVLSEVVDALKDITSTEDCVQCALDMFCYLCRSQLFVDGNKRVAQLVANKILIAGGVGILRIPYDKESVRLFRDLLVDYYETNNKTDLQKFLLDNAILKSNSCTVFEYEGRTYSVEEIVQAYPEAIVNMYATHEEFAHAYVAEYAKLIE